MEKIKIQLFVRETLQKMTEEENRIIVLLCVDGRSRQETRKELKIPKEKITKTIDKFKRIYQALEW